MRHLPLALIYSRLVLSMALVGLAWAGVAHFATIAIGLITVGLLTDIFDGIIARQLGISSEKLRRLDSTIDQFFWVMVVGAVYLECPGFFVRNAGVLLSLLALEGLTYVVCFIRFRKEVATHSWAAKVWVLLSFAALIQIITTCESGLLFKLSLYLGVLSRVEIVVILLLLRKWANDVPTCYHALLLRRNKPIKRHKLLNG